MFKLAAPDQIGCMQCLSQARQHCLEHERWEGLTG